MEYAGIGQNDVDATELGGAAIRCRVKSMDVTDVRHLDDTTTSGLFNQPLGLVEVLARRQVVGHRIDLRTDVDRDDVGAILGQSDRVRPPLAPRCPGDEGDLSLEHPLLPLRGHEAFDIRYIRC